MTRADAIMSKIQAHYDRLEAEYQQLRRLTGLPECWEETYDEFLMVADKRDSAKQLLLECGACKGEDVAAVAPPPEPLVTDKEVPF